MASAGSTDGGKVIAFQGAPGAYSHLACREVYPAMTALPCTSFEDAFEAVGTGQADLAMIPIENSQAGRVADIHLLIPHTDLAIVGEHFHRVQHCLLGLPGSRLADIKTAYSHAQALGQCRLYLRKRKIAPRLHHDTADAARLVKEMGDPAAAAIASRLAGEIHGLAILDSDVEDAAHNTTRFVILAREPIRPDPAAGPVMTSLLFAVRNVPAALYKALGGFATNGVNMTKLESYMTDGGFVAAEFYAEIDGHPDDPAVKLALEELDFHSKWVKILGSYTQKRPR
ncbi:MAG: prephenate dehydratase [Alphaproteobacteria bacterium]|nr:MAG: prephenate dehydratase [Alphaproteobacteria bacterium]